MEYLIIFFVVVVFASYNRSLTRQSRVIALICVCAYIILLMGLRYRVGIDTINYMHAYDWTPSLDGFFDNDYTVTRFEPGYLFLCALCRSVTREFWLLQLVHSLILNVCVFVFLYRHTRNPFTGVAVYFILVWLYFNTEVMRESLAVSFFLLNYENLRRRKWNRYYLLSLLSISFQFSAVITLLFPLVKYLRLNIWYIAACLGILLIMPWAEQLNQAITIASVADRVSEHIASADRLNLNWRIANTIRAVICPVIGLLVYHRIHKDDMEIKPYVLLNILFGVGAFTIPIIFSRFANYTAVFVVVYIANLLSELKYRPLLKFAVVCVLLLSQSQYYYKMFWRWYPYESVFTMKKIPEREKLWRDYNM